MNINNIVESVLHFSSEESSPPPPPPPFPPSSGTSPLLSIQSTGPSLLFPHWNPLAHVFTIFCEVPNELHCTTLDLSSEQLISFGVHITVAKSILIPKVQESFLLASLLSIIVIVQVPSCITP